MTALKSAIRRAMPARVMYEIDLRRGRTLARDIDLDRTRLLADASARELADPAALEALVTRLGLNDDVPDVMPPSLRAHLGEGLRIWQYPRQFARYLAFLRPYPVRSYLEIGIQHGGSFVATCEYLRATGHRLERAIAVDISYSPGVARYARQTPAARQINANTRSDTFRREIQDLGPFDLALIDGDHSYDGCRHDFETVHGHAAIVAFHDIVDDAAIDVRRVWEHVRAAHGDEYDFHEFVDQYPDVHAARGGATYLGLGVAVRRGYAAAGASAPA